MTTTPHFPAAVFWDWDGTLADSFGFLAEAHSHTREALGLAPITREEYLPYFGKPRETIYPALYPNKEQEAIEVFGKYVVDNCANIETISGAEDVLKLFKAHNVYMGIVSNKKADLIKEELKHNGWDEYFSVVVGAGDAAHDKPATDPLELALKTAGGDWDRADIWYVGDTENDLACAKATGVKVIFKTGTSNTDALIHKYSPDYCYETYQEFHDFLVAISRHSDRNNT